MKVGEYDGIDAFGIDACCRQPTRQEARRARESEGGERADVRAHAGIHEDQLSRRADDEGREDGAEHDRVCEHDRQQNRVGSAPTAALQSLVAPATREPGRGDAIYGEREGHHESETAERCHQ